MWNNDNDLWDVYNDRVLCVYELNGFKIYIKIVIFNLKVIIEIFCIKINYVYCYLKLL